MGKKSRRSNRRGRPPRARRPDPRRILQSLAVAWREHYLAEPRGKRTYSWAIGTLIAGKLILLARNDGGTSFEGDPEVWEMLEQLSDTLADELLAPLAQSMEVELVLPGRLESERPYLRLVRGERAFRWASKELGPDSEIHDEERDRLEGTQDSAMRLAARVVELVSSHRPASMAVDVQQDAVAAEVVAVMAACKLVLAILGNGRMAAVVEQLAEQVASNDYHDLVDRYR